MRSCSAINHLHWSYPMTKIIFAFLSFTALSFSSYADIKPCIKRAGHLESIYSSLFEDRARIQNSGTKSDVAKLFFSSLMIESPKCYGKIIDWSTYSSALNKINSDPKVADRVESLSWAVYGWFDALHSQGIVVNETYLNDPGRCEQTSSFWDALIEQACQRVGIQ